MRNVIFDFNGTLYQDTPLHYCAWKAFCLKYGLPFSTEFFYKSLCGPPNRDILLNIMPERLSDAELDALSAEKEALYRQAVLDDPSLRPLTPGAVETLDALKERNTPMAIATGSIRANCEFYLEVLGVSRWFDMSRIFYDDGTLPGKPDPAIYRNAMARMGFTPGETVVVEDTLSGVASAAGAGAGRIIAIDTTLGPEAFAGNPDVYVVIHDFHGFERFVDQ